MLLEYIARYYKILWLAFVAIAFIKVIISYSFNANQDGINGILYTLFKWYGEDEQEMEDLEPRRTMMRLYNVVTIILYCSLTLILMATILTRIIPH